MPDILSLPSISCVSAKGAKAHSALAEYAAAQFVPADFLRDFDQEGRVQGTDYRLSREAFVQLCVLTKTPPAFIDRLATRNMGLALQAVGEIADGYFPRDAYLAGIGPAGVIQGFRPAADELPDLVKTVEAAEGAGLKLAHFSGEGITARAVLLSDKAEAAITPRKGDVMRWGTSVWQRQDYGQTQFSAYFERLICMNGMVRQDSRGVSVVEHYSYTGFDAEQFFEDARGSTEEYYDRMRLASQRLLLPEDVDSIRHSARRLGGVTCEKEMCEYALKESAGADVSLWDMVNGINFHAHRLPRVEAKLKMERGALEVMSGVLSN